jgi:hypothetical protein
MSTRLLEARAVRRNRILIALHYAKDWTPVAAIAKTIGAHPGGVGSALRLLEEEKLVENRVEVIRRTRETSKQTDYVKLRQYRLTGKGKRYVGRLLSTKGESR